MFLKSLYLNANAMLSTGNITRIQFNKAIENFRKKSEFLNDSWSINNVETMPEVQYLVKRKTMAIHVKKQIRSEELEDELESTYEDSEPDYDVCLGSTDELLKIATFEYHVVYSSSYNVPVLYFSAWKQDGRLLSLEEIWENVPSIHRDFLTSDKWSFITQQEHPVLGRPYFIVHPCHTTELMRQLLMKLPDHHRNELCYFTTWLTAVGQAVGLQISAEFGINRQ